MPRDDERKCKMNSFTSLSVFAMSLLASAPALASQCLLQSYSPQGVVVNIDGNEVQGSRAAGDIYVSADWGHRGTMTERYTMDFGGGMSGELQLLHNGRVRSMVIWTADGATLRCR